MPRPRRRGGRLERHDRGGAGAGRTDCIRAPGGVPRHRRRPVRVLHPGPARIRPGAARRGPAPDARRDPGGARREPLPVRGLRADLRGRRGDRGRRADGSVRLNARATSRRRAEPGPVGAGQGRGVAQPRRRRRAGHRRAGVPRGPPCGRPPRQARHARRRASADRRRSTRPRRSRCPASTRPDRRRPATADAPFRAAARGPPGARDGETTYHGEPVALVVAETKDLAERAARARPRRPRAAPAVFTLEGALAPDAPLVQDPALRPDDPLAGTNVLAEHRSAGATSSRPRPGPPRRRGHLHVPDGHPVRDRAARVHGRARRGRGRGLEHDPAPQLAPAGHRRDARDAARQGARLSRPTRAAASAASSTRSTSRRSCSRRSGSAGPSASCSRLEETFQAVRRAACETHVRTGFAEDGRILFQDIAADYLIGAYTDIADRVVGKGSYPGAGRTTSRPCGSSPGPSSRTRCRRRRSAASATRRSTGPSRRRSTRGRAALGIDPLELRLRNLARRGDRFIPFDTPCDGDWAEAVRVAAERPGGATAPRGPRPRDRLRHQVRPDDRALLLDRAAARGRRPSSSTRGRRTWGRARGRSSRRSPRTSSARRSSGSRSSWATPRSCPYDQQTSASPVDGPHGQRRPRRVPQDPGAARGDGRAAPRRRRGGRHGRRGRRPAAGRHRARRRSTCSSRGSGGWAASSPASASRARTRSRTTRWAARPRSSSSTARSSRRTSTRRRATSPIDRHVTVSDVGKAINPLQVRMQDEGAAIMGLGHTLMEQYLFDDEGRIRNLGAIDYRIPTSMDLPTVLESEIVENGDGPGPYGAKGMSEGALLCVAPGGRLGGPRRDGRGDPGAAAHARSASGTPSRRGRHLPAMTSVYASDHATTSTPRRAHAAARRQGREPRDDGGRARPARAARRSRSRPRPATRTSPRAGRPASTRSSARRWRGSRRASGGGSATRRTRCSCPCAPAPRGRCPG